eukprot:scaffold80964_cov57-Attheya_sp.AAC.6
MRTCLQQNDITNGGGISGHMSTFAHAVKEEPQLILHDSDMSGKESGVLGIRLKSMVWASTITSVFFLPQASCTNSTGQTWLVNQGLTLVLADCSMETP